MKTNNASRLSATGPELASLIESMPGLTQAGREKLSALCAHAYAEAAEEGIPSTGRPCDCEECQAFLSELTTFGFEKALELLGYEFEFVSRGAILKITPKLELVAAA